MRFIHICLFALCILGAQPWVHAQSVFGLWVVEPHDRIAQKVYFNSQQELYSTVKERYKANMFNGYYGVQVDTVRRNDSLICMYNQGSAYHLRRIRASENTFTQFKAVLQDDLPVDTASHLNITDLYRIYELILDRSIRNGYPFYQWKIDLDRHEKDSVDIIFSYHHGGLMLLDTLRWSPEVSIRSRIMRYVLGLGEKTPYNIDLLRSMSARLLEYDIMQLSESPRLYYSTSSYAIDLQGKPIKSSYFDGVLGLVRHQTTGNYKLIGDIRLQLNNSFRSAERLFLSYRSLQDESIDFKAELQIPFFLSRNLGFRSSLNMFRRDSSFLEIAPTVSFSYVVNRNSSLTALLEWKWQTPINKNYGDLKGNGASYQAAGLRYRWYSSPRPDPSISRMAIQFEATGGSKKYGDANQSRDQYRMAFAMEANAIVAKRWSFVAELKAEGLFSDSLQPAEYLRLGGFKNLRGFAEESLSSSAYAFYNLETRLFLERDTWMFVFFNAAFLPSKPNITSVINTANGFGLGLSLKTISGQLSFVYALGYVLPAAIDFNTTKIHIGYKLSF
jgi:outer membrane protein assembly factor BamA